MTTYSTALLRFDGVLSIAAGSTPLKVKGSNGADTVTIGLGVVAILDGSFNRGNDVVNFAGLASTYSVTKINSSTIQITDAAGTSVTIPVGTTGTTIQFADASRELKAGASGVTLGTQVVTATAAAVAQGSGVAQPFADNADAGTLPGADASSFNTIILADSANVVLGEDSAPTKIRGSNASDTVEIADGTVVVLDASFNRGNDTIILSGNAEDYLIARSGSSAVKITDASGTSVTIPVGSNGTTISFANADRELIIGAGGITLGTQVVTSVPTSLVPGEAIDKVFTLDEAVLAGTPGSPGSEGHLEVYWGYNPHAHNETGVDNEAGGNTNNNTNEGPEDGGIPLTELVSFLTTITGLDLADLGLIDDDGVGPFDNVTNLTISGALSLTGSVSTGDGGNSNNESPVLVLEYIDGTTAQFNIEAQIGEMYFDWLNSLLFDAEGNSRLFTKMVGATEGTSGTPDTLVPIVLTPTENNGGTIETGFTGRGDDLIVVPRLELLHQAYIDGGAGHNTLQIDAKGTYAQPLEVLNVQEVHVIDLPNFYTTDYGSGDGNLQNTEFTDSSLNFPNPVGSGSNDSWIDLSNAHDIEKLVVTDQGSDGSFNNNNGNGSTASGNLFVVGVQNGAVLRLEGAFVSGTTTIQYGPGINADGDGKFNLELAIGEVVGSDINIVQNLDVMEIKSEGIANNLDTFFAGGHLTELYVTGTGKFSVAEDISDSFSLDTPVVIDASANTGGVDLILDGAQNVDIVGSKNDDRFIISTDEVDGWPGNDEVVTIAGGVGDNYYEVHGADKVAITNADGNNDYEIGDDSDAVAEVTITAGNGDNTFEIANVAVGTFTVGNGDNRFDIGSTNEYDYNTPDNSLEFGSCVTIVAGNGQNVINVDADPYLGVVEVTAGNGGNEIAVQAAEVTVTTGTGTDYIVVEGQVITVTSGGGSDTIQINGTNQDYADAHQTGGNSTSTQGSEGSNANGDDGALITINAGSGSSTVILGSDTPAGTQDNNFPGNGTITALEGSSITGSAVTLVVNTEADLRAATLTGVTKVILDDDNDNVESSPTANEATAGGNAAVLTLTSTQFKAIGAANFSVEGAVFNTHAFIKIIVDETTSLSQLGVDNLPKNIDLILELQDGVTLTMTAQQLHTRVAQAGVIIADDGNTDGEPAAVVITGGGLDFDPFNTTDLVETYINTRAYYGGSLSSDFDDYNVFVNSVYGGYDRPADAVNQIVLTIDSDVTATVGALSTFHTNLLIVGDDDITFTSPIKLGMAPSGTTNVADKPFNIDFSELNGEAINLVVDNFERLSEGGSIVGNAAAGVDAEVFVSIEADSASTHGFDDHLGNSLHMSGVNKLTVLTIENTSSAGVTSTINLCDTTIGLETLALVGNYQDTLVVNNAAWGLVFELQGGGTAKAEGPTGTSNVGKLEADFMWAGADAVVNMTHSVAGDTRALKSYGIDIDNAKSITVNTGASSATIDAISGDSGLKVLTFNSDANITIGSSIDVTNLSTIDASGVSGNFTGSTTGDSAVDFLAADGTTNLTLNGFDAASGASFVADAAATFNITAKDVSSDTTDLTKATLTNVDKLTIDGTSTVDLTAAQALAIGLANIVTTGSGHLNITNLGSQAFDVTTLGAGVVIGTVTTASGSVTLDPATNLKGADVVVSGTLTLTADQYMALNSLNGDADSTVETINITGVTQAHIDAGFSLANVGGATGTVTFVGDVNLKSTTDLHGFAAVIGAGNTLGLATQAQADGLKVTGGADSTVKLLFGELSTTDLTIDVSKYAVSKLLFLDLLVVGHNVDAIFTGMPATLVKEVYNLQVQLIDQTFNVQPGTFVRGDVSFDRVEDNLELRNFTLNLMGGAVLDGSLDLSVSDNDADLIQTFFQTLTINSTGTAANPQTGDTTNYINENVGALGGSTTDENQILAVVINAEQDLVIGGTMSFTSTVNPDEVATLTVNGTADVSIAELSTADNEVDGLDVVNNGTGTLTVGINGANVDADDDFSFTGPGDIVLSIGGTVNLSDDDLSSVSAIVLETGSTLSLTMAQADAIGAANFSAPGAATLNLSGLAGEPFALANYDADINVDIVTIAALPVVTLNALTDLTGIDQLVVPEGTVLNLTAAQYQQLSGSTVAPFNKIVGEGSTTDYTVNITDLTQADVGTELDLSLVTAATATITLIGDVELGANSDLGSFDVAIGAHKLTLADIQQADGIDFTGSTLEFQDSDTDPFEDIDASGFNVTTLRFLNSLTDNGNRNIDDIFTGLPGSVLKVIFQDEGSVETIDQTVTIEAGASVLDSLTFNPPADNQELEDFTLNLSGGVDVNGNIRLSTTDKEDADGNDLLRSYLKTVVINSLGTATNPFTGVAANVIHGDITAEGFGAISIDNNLLDVTINAEQAFILAGDGPTGDGQIVFNSTAGDDDYEINDKNDALAKLTITGPAPVTLAGVDITDAEVSGLEVTHNGTGILQLTIDNDDAGKDLFFLGTGPVHLTASGSNVDLSDDTITAVDQITIADNSTLVINQDQLDALGNANIKDDGTPVNVNLTVNGVDSSPFNAATIDTDINVKIILADTNVTLTGDFTDVTEIVVQEGRTVTMTADQFQSLRGTGTITTVDTNGNSTTTPINIVITGLTQAHIDAGFDLDGINTGGAGLGSVTISLADSTVNLAKFLPSGLQVTGTDADIITGNNLQADFILADGQTLGLTTLDQANHLTVTGGLNTTIIYKFSNLGASYTTPTNIDASGYDVTTLRALAASFSNAAPGNNTEFSINDLPNDTTLSLYNSTVDLGYVLPDHRIVVVEEDVTVGSNGLIFNDWDPEDEVRTLDITLSGNSEINGSSSGVAIAIPTKLKPTGSPNPVQRYFDELTIHSEGTEENTIVGDISAAAATDTSSIENNLLNISIEADQDLVIDGDILFNSITVPSTNNVVATLDIEGAADVSIDSISTADTDIDALVVDLTDFTGVLDPILDVDNTESVTLTNDDATAGTAIFQSVGDGGAGPDAELSDFDASEFDGTLTIDNITDVDNKDFTFTSGAGKTVVTLTDNGLGSAATTEPGWFFDFSDAGVGSELHVKWPTTTPLGELRIDMGANGTLFLDNPTPAVPMVLDFSDLLLLDIDTSASHPIVLGDNITLLLTPAQANGLHIVGASGTSSTGVVNIVDLTDAPSPVAFDLSGISDDVAGTITFATGEDDVTLHASTKLGDFSVTLDDVNSTAAANELAGETIRFTNLANQADGRVILIVNPDSDPDENDTNVVWLFPDSEAPVGTVIDTVGYSAQLGRLWVRDTLVDGRNFEEMTTTLNESIIVRIENDNVLTSELATTGYDRHVEVEANTILTTGLTFTDIDNLGQAYDFVENLRIDLGGQVNLGNTLEIGNILAGPISNDDEFNTLTINSMKANGPTHYLLPDLQVGQKWGPGLDIADTVDGVDQEVLTISALDTIDNGNEVITISYLLNGLSQTLTVNTAAMDVTNLASVVEKIAAEFAALPGFTAVGDSLAGTVTVSGPADTSLRILSMTVSGTTDGLAGTQANGADVAQQDTITITDAAPALAAGDIYTITVELADGNDITASYVVQATDLSVGTPQNNIATGLAAAFNAASGGIEVSAAAATNTVVLSDIVANNGGFTSHVTVAGRVALPTDVNIVGDIRVDDNPAVAAFDLGHVVINTGTGLTSNAIEIETIYFSDDGDGLINGGTVATFDALGDSDVTVKSFDTSDIDLTGLIVTNNLSVGATLTVTGGSPAFDGGVGNASLFKGTETLTIAAQQANTTVFGSTVGSTTYAGIYGEELSAVVITGPSVGPAVVDLGVVIPDAQVFTVSSDPTTSVSLTLGAANANGPKASTLSATGAWNIGLGGTNDRVTITSGAVFAAGGALTITGAENIDIVGAVNLSALNLTISPTGDVPAGTSVNVPLGSTLTLNVADAANLRIEGDGSLVLVGVVAGALALDHINVRNIDLSALTEAVALSQIVTLDVSDETPVRNHTILGATNVRNNITGNNGTDSITGGSLADTLNGAEGNDTLLGLAGNDVLTGGTGNDSLDGGADNDTLNGDAGSDTLIGGLGNDSLTGGADADSISGGAGNDTINGADSNDTISGGADNDLLQVYADYTPPTDASLTEIENIEVNTVTLGATVDVDLTSQTEGFNIFATDAGLFGVSVLGGSGNDTITGAGGADTLNGGLGNDIVDGGAGADSLLGGLGNDTIIGASNDALLDGDNGTVVGGGTNDVLEIRQTFNDNTLTDTGIINIETVNVTVGGLTVDIDGQTENLTINTYVGYAPLTGVVTQGTGSTPESTAFTITQSMVPGDSLSLNGLVVTASGAPGTTYTAAQIASVFRGTVVAGLALTGAITGPGAPAAATGTGADVVFTNNVNGDVPDVNTSIGGQGTNLLAGSGNDTINGGNGNDTLSAGGGNDVVNAGLGNDSVSGLAGADTINGQGGNDTLLGGTGNDAIDGGVGNDSLEGGDNVDSLMGGDGDDTIIGDDTTPGAEFADSLYGGAGNDNFVFANALDYTTDATVVGGTGTDTLTFLGTTLVDADFDNTIEVEAINFAGSPGPHSVTLGTNANAAFNNVVITVTGAGNLTVDGSAFAETITATGTDAGTDSLVGGSAADTLNGAGGADTIVGNGGADNLVGGLGEDTIVGSSEDALIDGDNGTVVGGGVADVLQTGAAFNDASDGQIINVEVAQVTVNTGASLNLGDQTEGFTINGSDDTTVVGETGQDTITGGAGNDTINGAGGNDSLAGGAGNDVITGGDSTVAGGGNNDTLSGGAGNDTLVGGEGVDTFAFVSTDPAETDTITNFGEDQGSDILSGAMGAGDVLVVTLASSLSGLVDPDVDPFTAGFQALATSNAVAPSTNGSATFADQYNVGDVITLTIAGSSGTMNITRTVIAGHTSGFDVAKDFEQAIESLELNLAFDPDLPNGTPSGPAAATVQLLGTSGALLTIGNDNGGGNGYPVTFAYTKASGVLFDAYASGTGIASANGAVSVTGFGLNDTIIGGNGNDTLNGGNGTDSILGQGGADIVNGLADGANDVFDGGLGNDTINGADSADVVIGGGDSDVLNVSGNYTPASDTNLEGIETINYTDVGASAINLGAQLGESFTVNVVGGDGTTVTTADGDDVVNTGSFGADVITTGAGNDTIVASIGTDTINAGTGVDVITLSGIGRVIIADGDSGLTAATADTINNFSGGAGDRISIGLNGDGTVGTGNYIEDTDGAASFAAALAEADAAFTAQAGTTAYAEMYYFTWVGTTGYLFEDDNAGGLSDQVIILSNLGTAASFDASYLIA